MWQAILSIWNLVALDFRDLPSNRYHVVLKAGSLPSERLLSAENITVEFREHLDFWSEGFGPIKT